MCVISKIEHLSHELTATNINITQTWAKVCLCIPCCEVLLSFSNRSTELQQTVYGSLFHITFPWSCFELFILASLSILKYWDPFTCFKILEAKILHHIAHIPCTVKLFKEKNIRRNFQKLKSKEAHYMETTESAGKCSKDTENSCRKKCPPALYRYTSYRGQSCKESSTL